MVVSSLVQPDRMANLWLLWVIFGCTVSISYQQAKVEIRAEQVFVTRHLCNTLVQVGSSNANWKRLLFPAYESCRASQTRFDCTLVVGTYLDIPLATDVCVDFSRLQLYGNGTELNIHEGDGHILKEGLNISRYPGITQFMPTMVCIDAKKKLLLNFRSDCDKPLDKFFVSWMYVYLQSFTTGSVYFLDGTCEHRHRMSKYGQPMVTLRSHVWADTPGELRWQSCSIRLSLGIGLRWAKLCVSWDPQVVPWLSAGISVSIMRTYFGADLTDPAKYYRVLKPGDVMTKGYQKSLFACYAINDTVEVTFAVYRDKDKEVPHALNDGQLLFQVRTKITTTDEPYDFLPGQSTISSGAESMDSTGPTLSYVLKFMLGSTVIIGVVICICYVYSKRSQRARNGGSTCAQQPGQQQESTNVTVGNTVTTTRHSESHPMLSVTGPSASREAQMNDAPPSYEDVSQATRPGPPPAYRDLFPVSAT